MGNMIIHDAAVQFLDDPAGVEKEAYNKISNPPYYTRWKIEPLDFIEANNLDFLRGNIIKYIMRHDGKNGLEDLKKARFYLDRIIKEHDA